MYESTFLANLTSEQRFRTAGQSELAKARRAEELGPECGQFAGCGSKLPQVKAQASLRTPKQLGATEHWSRQYADSSTAIKSY
jgi:hypothetical protein